MRTSPNQSETMTAFKTTPIQIKTFGTDTGIAGQFQGLAAAFGNVDRYGDVIEAGAFTRSLERYRQDGTAPAMLWQHEQNTPIGSWQALHETQEGLDVTGLLVMDAFKAKEAHALMLAGGLSLSIGYQVPEGGAYIRDDGARVLRELELLEISTVAVPANSRAAIRQVKNFNPEEVNVREFEAAARDALGLSAREVKRLLSGGWNALIRDEQAKEEMAYLIEELGNINQILLEL